MLPPFHSQAIPASSVLLYIKQNPTGAAIYMDWAEALIQGRYIGELIYLPGKTYRLTHRSNPTIAPKLFTVISYTPPETLSQTDSIEIDLVLRYFNPYTQEPRPNINRVRFPICLDDSLSSKLWHIQTVDQPSQGKALNDEIIPLLTRDTLLRSAAPEIQPQQSQRATASPDLNKAFRPALSQPSRPGIIGATTPTSLTDNPSVNSQHVDVAASDIDRVREILKRWVKLSDATPAPWRSRPNDNQGITVEDNNGRVIFDFCTAMGNIIRTPESALVLQERLMQVATTASNQLSPETEEKLFNYAQDVSVRLQIAPTESVPDFLRSLFNLRAVRKPTKPPTRA